jgi:acetoin utilization deacetylase AcuC-like enzyme
MMTTLLLAGMVGFHSDPLYREHRTGAGFPERPERITVIENAVRDLGVTRVPALAEPLPWIYKAHGTGYVESVRKFCAGLASNEVTYFAADVPVSARSYDVAVRAVGGVLGMVDAVMAGKVRSGFCAVRPPGHHALPQRAMGFCLFNNVAVAARYLREKHGIKRVLIVDWDVHHGNGTEEIFAADESVLYFSSHQHPFYPGTGASNVTGRAINVLLPAGAGDAELLRAYREQLIPAARQFRPEFVLISCGFDAHENDLLGGLAVTTAGFAELTRIVRDIAGEHAGGRLVSVLEGGYNLENLAAAAAAHVRALQEAKEK